MIPVIAARGASFAGAFAYYCHDKRAWTSERVAWTRCLNLMTDCVTKAWKRMAYTAKHQGSLKRASGQRMTGARLQKPVFSYSLSWHPEQNPSQDEMMTAVMETLDRLGLSEHQAVIVAHRDEPHPHVHVVINAVHPLTGLVAKLKHTKRKLSEFALNHERREGKVYCKAREKNQAKRNAGETTKHCDPVIAGAWQNSSNGAGFVAALSKQGYRLVKGRRLVIIDPHNNVINAARALGLKKKEFETRLGEVEIAALNSFEDAKRDFKVVADKPQQKPQHGKRENEGGEWLERKAEAMNLLALKQSDELSALSARHDWGIDQKVDQLRQFYQIRETKNSIAKLETRQQKSGFLQRLLGLHKRREHRLHNLKAELADAQNRFDETINPMVEKKKQALEKLRAVHLEQQQALKRSFEQWMSAPSNAWKIGEQRNERLNIHRDDGPKPDR